MGKLHFTRSDYAVFVMFTAYALGSFIVPMCLVSIADDLAFPLASGGMGMGGSLQLIRSFAITAMLLACGFVAAHFGKRRPVGLAAMVMALGVLLAAGASNYYILLAAMMVAGLGEGVVEGLTNPMMAALHPEEPGRYVNITYGFWSGGLVLATVLGGWLLELGIGWRIIIMSVSACGLVSGLMLLVPDTKAIPEGSADGGRNVIPDTVLLLKTPRFYIYLTALFLAGGCGFGLSFWCPAFVQLAFGTSAAAAGMAAAVFALGMMTSRMFAGIFVHDRFAPRLLIMSSLLAAAASLAFAWTSSKIWVFPLLFAAGTGTGPLWPTIETLCMRRLPDRNSTQIFIVLSASGIPGCGIFSVLLGHLGDLFGIRAAMLTAPVCFLITAALIAIDNRKPSICKNQ
ncbi:MAG: sugar MFS transporter [Victivallaceae bacterium]|nr:MFS transporter [Victivallaceae bacterium]